MLSKSEQSFLEDESRFSRDHAYVLEHRIKKKLQKFYRLELSLIKQNQKIPVHDKVNSVRVTIFKNKK